MYYDVKNSSIPLARNLLLTYSLLSLLIRNKLAINSPTPGEVHLSHTLLDREINQLASSSHQPTFSPTKTLFIKYYNSTTRCREKQPDQQMKNIDQGSHKGIYDHLVQNIPIPILGIKDTHYMK